MDGVALLRSAQVAQKRERKQKGPLHQRLHAVLAEQWQTKLITQESLAEAIGQSQENVGQYLREGKAGALSLDEAAAALQHINTTLEAFLAGRTPVAPTRAQLVGRRLEERPELVEWVEALLAVPPRRLGVVLGQINAGVFAATGRGLIPLDESADETTEARRTRRGPKPRR